MIEKMPSASCDTFLNDIEDIVSQEDSKPQDRHFSRKHVVPKVRRRNTQKYLQEETVPQVIGKLLLRLYSVPYHGRG